MKFLTYTMLILFLFLPSVYADQDTDAVKALVKEKIDQVTALIKDKSLDKKIRNDKIIALVTPILDFEFMAKLSLGRKHWKSFSKSQRKEFVDLFVTQLQDSFLEKLDLYTDEKVTYGEAKRVKTKIEVRTLLISKDSKYDIVYKFYKSKKAGQWLGYDIEIIGVSVVQTYRTQFDAAIKKDGIGGLLSKMRKKGEFTIPEKEPKKA